MSTWIVKKQFLWKNSSRLFYSFCVFLAPIEGRGVVPQFSDVACGCPKHWNCVQKPLYWRKRDGCCSPLTDRAPDIATVLDYRGPKKGPIGQTNWTNWANTEKQINQETLHTSRPGLMFIGFWYVGLVGNSSRMDSLEFRGIWSYRTSNTLIFFLFS